MLPPTQIVPNHHGRYRYFPLADPPINSGYDFTVPPPQRCRFVAMMFSYFAVNPGPDDRVILRFFLAGLVNVDMPASSPSSPGIVIDDYVFADDEYDSPLVLASNIVTLTPHPFLLNPGDHIQAFEPGAATYNYIDGHIVLETWIET